MYKNKFFLFVLSLFLFLQFTVSQNNTNSPYTRFGYGDISDTNSGEQRAMGGISLGSRSHSNINSVNPASYSSVDSMTFMFDIGSSALVSRFSTKDGSKTTSNANLEYVTMQFPLTKWMGCSAGLLPYSFSGYDFQINDTIAIKGFDSSIAKTATFKGTGGFSQVYTGISANLFNHVSLGVNAYYMYGSINNYRGVSFSNSTFGSSAQTNSIKADNFRFRYGVQFYNTFAKKNDVTLGVIYERKNKLNSSLSQTTTDVLTDTIHPNFEFDCPTMYGVGLYYTYNKKLSIGFDYTMQEWKDAKFFGKTDSLSNRSKIAVGLEYLPNPKGRKYSEKIRYRAGFNITDSYFKVDGVTPPKNIGLSLGFGLPLRTNNNKTILNTTFEYGKIGNANKLREDYFKFTFNIAFNENWFFKRKL